VCIFKYLCVVCQSRLELVSSIIFDILGLALTVTVPIVPLLTLVPRLTLIAVVALTLVAAVALTLVAVVALTLVAAVALTLVAVVTLTLVAVAALTLVAIIAFAVTPGPVMGFSMDAGPIFAVTLGFVACTTGYRLIPASDGAAAAVVFTVIGVSQNGLAVPLRVERRRWLSGTMTRPLVVSAASVVNIRVIYGSFAGLSVSASASAGTRRSSSGATGFAGRGRDYDPGRGSRGRGCGCRRGRSYNDNMFRCCGGGGSSCCDLLSLR